jgi:hypothetical protein
MKTYNFGRTYDYFIPSVLIIVTGGLCCILSILAGLPVIVIGLLLLFTETGIEIDEEKKTIRKYTQLFRIKKGSTYQLNQIDHLELKYTHETQTLQHRAGSTTMETKTFDLIITNKSNSSSEFHEFDNYTLAREIIVKIAAVGNIRYTDQVHDIREAIQKRKQERHYK